MLQFSKFEDFDVILLTQSPQRNQMFSRNHNIAFDTNLMEL